jgi:molecular chaperone HscB
MNLKQTFFELFDLPERYRLDEAALDERYRELQREVHPDRYARASQAEQRVAMQLATRVNEAYRALRSPIERARYLLSLRGVDPELETNTAMPQAFLMEQMELREALDEAVDAADQTKLTILSTQLRGERAALVAKIASQLDAQSWADAAATLRQLMFLERFGEDIEAAEEGMEG